MTTQATKRTRVRRSAVPPGDVRRGAGGEIEMIEFNAYVRNPLAPKIFVNDVGGIYRIDQGIWQVVFINKPHLPEGSTDAVEQGSLIWPERRWHASGELFRWAMAEILGGKFQGDGPRRSAGH
jgi:hypothetical protein